MVNGRIQFQPDSLEFMGFNLAIFTPEKEGISYDLNSMRERHKQLLEICLGLSSGSKANPKDQLTLSR